jgi:hypothetical protein
VAKRAVSVPPRKTMTRLRIPWFRNTLIMAWCLRLVLSASAICALGKMCGIVVGRASTTTLRSRGEHSTGAARALPVPLRASHDQLGSQGEREGRASPGTQHTSDGPFGCSPAILQAYLGPVRDPDSFSEDSTKPSRPKATRPRAAATPVRASGSLAPRRSGARLLVRKVPVSPVKTPPEVQAQRELQAELYELRLRQMELDAAYMAAQPRISDELPPESSPLMPECWSTVAGFPMFKSDGVRPHARAFPLSSKSPWPAQTMRNASKSGPPLSDPRPLVDAAMLDPAYVVAWTQTERQRLLRELDS